MIKLHTTPSQAAAYVLLPRIIPRLYEIGMNFRFVAHLMAILYGMVGLLPRDHRFLRPTKRVDYSARQVFVEAARHLKFDRAHIDQVIIFFLLLAAFILLVAQFALMAIFLLTGIAYAQTAPAFTGMFSTAQPANDIALILLDRVFGVPDFFHSCISEPSVTCEATGAAQISEPTVYPEPFQRGLQSLFAFYSIGTMLIGGFILIYFVISVILESVQTGVPFGKRFASVYAPMRLCLAVLALVPLPLGGTGPYKNNLGYNAAQYLTLYITKLGSGFGTNSWNIFNNYFISGGTNMSAPGQNYGPLTGGGTGSPVGEMVAVPRPGRIDNTLEFIHMASACRYLVERGLGKKVEPFLSRPYSLSGGGTYLPLTTSTTYQTALQFVNSGNILVSFAEEDTAKKTITPLCGELVLRISDLAQPGAQALYESNFQLIAQMWNDPAITGFGERISKILMSGSESSTTSAPCAVSVPGTTWDSTNCDRFPPAAYYQTTRDTYQANLVSNVSKAWQTQVNNTNATIDPKILSRGWAGAGIWYTRLAQVNGALIDAAHALPDVLSMPVPMKSIYNERLAAMETITADTMYQPIARDGRELTTVYQEIGADLNRVYMYFKKAELGNAPLLSSSGNAIFDMMNALFGTEALFNMRDNVDTHPLVQMIAFGKSMVDRAIYNLIGGSMLAFTGGALSQIEGAQSMGEGLSHISKAWFSLTTIGLSFGILLYYVVPLMPFMYFFFSVIKWLMSIFEAMIGMPLWALAHLRIDGDGIPGEAAEEGYILLLEILIRPTLTVVGMITSFIVFTGIVYMLNDVFNLLIGNMSGIGGHSDPDTSMDLRHGVIDTFFFTIVYALLVYMIALGCFKLIDQIPANILKWMGSNASNIIDAAGDPAQNLIRNIYFGSFGIPVLQSEGGMMGQTVGSLREASSALGKITGHGVQDVINAGKKPG